MQPCLKEWSPVTVSILFFFSDALNLLHTELGPYLYVLTNYYYYYYYNCYYYYIYLFIHFFNHFSPLPNKPFFLRDCSKSLLKTPWEKEKLLVTKCYSMSHGELKTSFRTSLIKSYLKSQRISDSFLSHY